MHKDKNTRRKIKHARKDKTRREVQNTYSSKQLLIRLLSLLYSFYLKSLRYTKYPWIRVKLRERCRSADATKTEVSVLKILYNSKIAVLSCNPIFKTKPFDNHSKNHCTVGEPLKFLDLNTAILILKNWNRTVSHS